MPVSVRESIVLGGPQFLSHLSSNFSHSLQRNGEREREKQKEREDVSLAGERERDGGVGGWRGEQ